MSTKVKFFPDDSYQSSIVGSLHSQQQTGLNLDIKLLSGGHSVFIHSAMLLNSSPMLASLLRTPCFCSQPTDLILPPVYSPILSDFVSLLYLGYVADISKDKVKLLVSLATAVGIHNLSSEIRTQILYCSSPQSKCFEIKNCY